MAAAVENYPVPPCRPPLFNATPVEIEEDAARLVRNSSLLVDQLKRPDDDYKFSNTILQFIDAENLRLRDMRVIQFYRSTSTDSKLREASRKASKQLTDAESELFNRVDLHRAFSIVRSRNDLLDPEYQHYLLKIGESFEENGLSISDPERRQRFRDITTKLNALRSEGLKNLDTDATGIWLSQEELDGVPPNYFENRKTNSEVSASDENQSDLKFWVSAKDPDTLPVLKFAKNSETRKKTLIMRQQRAPGNVSVYREIITHRDEAARLLGFQNHAAFRTSSRIIQTPEAVQKLLNDLQTRFRFKRQEEVETLLAVKRQHASGESDNLYLWDKAFYSRIYQESTLSYNQESVMEYFSLEHCVLKMFDTFEHMFSIRIKPFKPRPEETWHETVTLYALWEGDESKSLFLGWLYVDPYPREGKYQHFGYYPLQPGCIMSTGERLYPAAAMVMNLPHPTETRPPLLLHDQLRRLFHELGHAMHSMLSKTKCARFHGPPGYDRDFAEAVSMMFENFLWIPEHMANISLHYSYLSPKYLEAWHRSNPGASPPPRHLSEDMIDNMIRAKDMGGAIDELTKIWHSKFDMAIHSPETPEELANLDLQVLWNQSMVEITGLKGPESEDGAFTWASGFSAFRAPVSGYDAGYYTYILSRFISDDLFYTGFREDTMNSERGARYRDIVLRPGGSKPSLEILREFLGRAPNDEAFNKEHSLTM